MYRHYYDLDDIYSASHTKRMFYARIKETVDEAVQAVLREAFYRIDNEDTFGKVYYCEIDSLYDDTL
jgi:hypothetical protein